MSKMNSKPSPYRPRCRVCSVTFQNMQELKFHMTAKNHFEIKNSIKSKDQKFCETRPSQSEPTTFQVPKTVPFNFRNVSVCLPDHSSHQLNLPSPRPIEYCIRGTCLDMCSKEERISRRDQSALHILESSSITHGKWICRISYS